VLLSLGTCKKNLSYRDDDRVVIQHIINQCSNAKMSFYVDSVLTGLVYVFSQSKNICSFIFHELTITGAKLA